MLNLLHLVASTGRMPSQAPAKAKTERVKRRESAGMIIFRVKWVRHKIKCWGPMITWKLEKEQTTNARSKICKIRKIENWLSNLDQWIPGWTATVFSRLLRGRKTHLLTIRFWHRKKHLLCVRRRPCRVIRHGTIWWPELSKIIKLETGRNIQKVWNQQKEPYNQTFSHFLTQKTTKSPVMPEKGLKIRNIKLSKLAKSPSKNGT